VTVPVSNQQQYFLDPLYGRIHFEPDLALLVQTPLLQRLRHVRQSNIDSVDMPAIANMSRFEHVLGVAHLAGEVGFRSSLKPLESLVLRASALVHDWAITAFGHLVEEAFQYVGARFNHEQRLRDIISGDSSTEIGGIDFQILVGREVGLIRWARKVGGVEWAQLLMDIMETIQGRGPVGRVIAGGIDLDNIDNVYRMAFHMGLPVDRELPERLTNAIVGLTGRDGDPVFRKKAEPDILRWREARRAVYQHLMLAKHDFVGKVMLLYATVSAHQAGELTEADWNLVDHHFIVRLLNSRTRTVRDTVERWVAGEPWDCSPLYWMSGDRPNYQALLIFSHTLSDVLNRPCFAYGIKDKRNRRLEITYDDGDRREYGSDEKRWLFGACSSKRKSFSKNEISKIFELASITFSSGIISDALEQHSEQTQACLL
jgi:uncharacterized protein